MFFFPFYYFNHKKNWKDKYAPNLDFTESCYRILSRAVLKLGGTSRGSRIDRYLSLSKRDILILDGREMAKLPRKYLIPSSGFFLFFLPPKIQSGVSREV